MYARAGRKVAVEGFDAAMARQALMGGFASSRILEVHGERMIKRTFDPGFRIELHQKDLRLALQGARAPVYRSPTRRHSGALQRSRRARQQGLGPFRPRPRPRAPRPARSREIEEDPSTRAGRGAGCWACAATTRAGLAGRDPCGAPSPRRKRSYGSIRAERPSFQWRAETAPPFTFS